MFFNLLIGLPVILLCLLLQSLISMGSLRFYLARLDRGRSFMNVSLPLFGVIVILMFVPTITVSVIRVSHAKPVCLSRKLSARL